MKHVAAIFLLLLGGSIAVAERPAAGYIFPAGGQRGTTVNFKVGGMYLHDVAALEMLGPGVQATRQIARTDTTWFEGPLMPLPASQQAEDYPKDFAGRVSISADAPRGPRFWRVWNDQGITPFRKFVVGEFPEVVEQEIDGDPIPVVVSLPVTINGRIFPREDVDAWAFEASARDVVTCDVFGARIGSPLEAHLEVLGPRGERIGENTGSPGPDGRLRFTAPNKGRYTLKIWDASFRGAQDFVYRLTVTKGPFVDSVFPLGGRRGSRIDLELSGANLPANRESLTLPAASGDSFAYRPKSARPSAGECNLELDDLPEVVEDRADVTTASRRVALPAILNGRILKPGEADQWEVAVKKGESWLLDLKAGRLGSPLDSVLTISDSTGKVVAMSDDVDGQTDSRLAWSVAADGRYRLRIEDRLPSRGGPAYSYRLKIGPAKSNPDFRLAVAVDSLNIDRGSEATLAVTADRRDGFNGPIDLSLDKLPLGVTASGSVIPAGTARCDVKLRADRKAIVGVSQVAIRGQATITGKPVVRSAGMQLEPGTAPIERVAVCVAIPTPFKFKARYDQRAVPRGTVYIKHYVVERNGYSGPLEIRIADRQFRHLQGVEGPAIIVPPGQNEFDYPLYLPPFMELLRTSRTNLMATGTLQDEDGSKHLVTYTTFDQPEQMVAVIAAGRLTLELLRSSVREEAGGTVRLPLKVNRAKGLTADVRVELCCPRHVHGVSADAVIASAGRTDVELPLHFAPGPTGPYNAPVTVRATTLDERNRPVVAEALLTVVPKR